VGIRFGCGRGRKRLGLRSGRMMMGRVMEMREQMKKQLKQLLQEHKREELCRVYA